MLIGLGAWTYQAVEGSLQELRAATMTSLLDAQVNALRVWVREEIGDAERVAREPGVREAAARLAAAAEQPGASRDGFCSGEARARVEEVLRPLLREVGDSTFNITIPSGRLIATRFPQYCGLRLTADRFLPLLAPVFKGESRFIRPFRDADRVESPPSLREGAAFGWIATPVRGPGNEVIAALGIAEPADSVLSAILAAARPGATGDLFAFDESGKLLTPSRFGASALFAMPGVRTGAGLAATAGDSLEPYASARGELGGQRKLGPYRLERVIGEGGMANIFLARHDLLKRPCAVKLLKPSRATDEVVARFEREVQLASTLSHPNVVEIYDYGRSAEGHFYYAMEYIEGINLGELMAREGVLPVPRALRVLHQLCAGLAAAHAAGLVHRDVKPENIMIFQRGEEPDVVKILDFGMVKRIDAEHSRNLTRGLRILGTPLYMAPECLRNPADVDARTDIYAVGAVAFYMLSGKKLFQSSDDLELTSKVLNEEPPRVSQVAAQPIPVELDLLVQACLEKKREDRPQRAADLLDALDGIAAEIR